MRTLRIGSMVALVAVLALAGCGPQEGGARVATPAEAPADAPAGKGATPSKKPRTHVTAESPKTQTSTVP